MEGLCETCAHAETCDIAQVGNVIVVECFMYDNEEEE